MQRKVSYEKWLSLFWAAGLLFFLVACTDSESGSQVAGFFTPSTVSDSADSSGSLTAEGPSAETSTNNSSEEQTGSDILIAYFSWADNAVLDGEVDAVASPSVTAPGNMQELAGWIQQETGGDLFSIRVTDPYSSDWDECLARANQERAENARPHWRKRWSIWNSMTPSFWVIPTGGTTRRWPFTVFWRHTIFPARS